jgi:hypothetical protein
MVKGGKGGGSTRTGLIFEKNVKYPELPEGFNYKSGKFNEVVNNYDEEIGVWIVKAEIYRYIDKFFPQIDLGEYESGTDRKEPDKCFINNNKKKVFIFEVKYQENDGSVDEKITNFGYLLDYYQGLFEPSGYEVEIVYVLSEWFFTNDKNKKRSRRKEKYERKLKYLRKNNIRYFQDAVGIEPEELF